MNLFGPCLRRIEPTEAVPNALHLTFDDGPVDVGTPETLDVLAKHGAKATFFVIGREAAQRRSLLARIRTEGHSIGNHSLDHSRMIYFSRYKTLKNWLRDGEVLLSDLLGGPSIGFRSPNGVRTPPLDRALAELGMPLIHWNVRFYDASWPWTEKKARRSLLTTAPGSIVLLHDRQKPEYRQLYLETLDKYLTAAKARGHSLEAITAQDAQSYFLEHGAVKRSQT